MPMAEEASWLKLWCDPGQRTFGSHLWPGLTTRRFVAVTAYGLPSL